MTITDVNEHNPECDPAASAVAFDEASKRFYLPTHPIRALSFGKISRELDL